MSKMCPVVHFELPADDKKRMSDFYNKAFGWQSKMMGKEMDEYVVVTTTEMGDSNFPKEPGRINGGFFQKSRERKTPSIVIAVEDINEAMKMIESAGGEIVGGQKKGKPDDIPGVGLYIAFKDTEGNTLGILEPKGM